jgi:archaetidylinositol phosphate synthase
MLETDRLAASEERRCDARLAHWLVTPLKHSWVAPNHLTTIRLMVGLSAAAAFLPGTYVSSNIAALLLVLSNFLDHADGELARISGKSSRFGHLYDLASDALVTVLLFIAIGVGTGLSMADGRSAWIGYPAQGVLAGVSVASIFHIRMRIEELAGKAATRQASIAGFETEDVMYLMPLVTLCNGLKPLLLAAAIAAPLYALRAGFEYRQVTRHLRRSTAGGAAQ